MHLISYRLQLKFALSARSIAAMPLFDRCLCVRQTARVDVIDVSTACLFIGLMVWGLPKPFHTPLIYG